MATVLEVRQALVARGYVPLPLIGKVPPFKLWQKVENVTRAMLEAWGRNWPSANNTGILTKHTPTLDADILNEPAAVAIEDLVRDRFEERGCILPRIGKPPKRAIPFRTLDPFAKITANLIAANGSTGEKIELMCNGQQIVAAGIHPDTLKPYSWPLGNPTDIAHDDLPDISEAEAKQLVEDIVALLCRDFGYSRSAGRPARKSNGAPAGSFGPDDWQQLVNDILAGNELHARTRDLAAKMVRSGMDGGAIVNFLRGLMNSSAAARDDRWQNRYDNLPRQVDTIAEKIARERAAAAVVVPTPSPPPPPPPPPPLGTGPAPSAAPGPAPSSPIEDTLAVFERWLLLADPTPVYAVLGAVAANLLDGDPVWLGLVGPPSSAKTEILNATSRLPNIVQAGTLTPAGLLSGTPKRQHGRGAVGGLLQQIGKFGIVALKDFGSILSMHPEKKAEVLAALREIYDGRWSRVLGTDGGRVLGWEGKIGLIFASTGVIDSHYSVIGAMGDRFLLSRLAPMRRGQFSRALAHSGPITGQMRKELAEAVVRLFAGRGTHAAPISPAEIARLDEAISLVVRLRGAVERDRRSGEIEAVYGAEGTARVGLMLERLLAGLDTLGVDRAAAMDVVVSVALDSVPPQRRAAYEHLVTAREQEAAGVPNAKSEQSTSEIATALGLPTNTVRRRLEDLDAYQLVRRKRGGQGNADRWSAY